VNKGAASDPSAVHTLPTDGGNFGPRVAIILVTLALIIWAIWQSKRTPTMDQAAAAETSGRAVAMGK